MVPHLPRAALELDGDLNLWSVDGVGAFDHVLRAQMPEGAAGNTHLQDLLPFVRVAHGRKSKYNGLKTQDLTMPLNRESGEQGDPLVFVVFALG